MASKKKIIDGVDTSAFTREELENFAYQLKEANDREREERNYFQIERDKIRTYWEITKSDLEEFRAQLKNRERQFEENEEKFAEELKFYKQKVKHLQYEQQNNLTETKSKGLTEQKHFREQFNIQEKELLQDKRQVRALLKEQQLGSLDQIKAMKILNTEELCKARVDFEVKAKEMEQKYEKKFVDLGQHLTTKYEMEISEVEELKNEHISHLIKYHEKSFNEMRNYYNDITLNNLTIINSLKAEMDKLREMNERMAKTVAELKVEIKRLKIPLAKADEIIDDYKRQLQNYDRDKMTLVNTKAILSKKITDFDALQWSYDTLETRFETLEKELDELRNRFTNGILEIQRKTSIKNLLLHKRIKCLTELAEYRETVIAELQNAATVPPARTNQKLEEILSKKNAAISDLQYELARVCKMHDDLLVSFEEKLLQFGIPKSELGFVPLRIIPEGQGGLSTAPAGLVTKNQ